MTTRMILRTALGVAVAYALILAATNSAIGQSAGFEAISIDMDSAGNAAESLGSREECREALPGDTITIDVTIEGISPSTPMFGYNYRFGFPGPTIAVTARDQIKLVSNPNSQPFDASEPLPQLGGVWTVSALDVSNNLASYESGSGVLDRLGLEVATDAAPGIYFLELSEAILIDPAAVAHSPLVTYNARLAIGVSCSGSTPVPPVFATTTPAASKTDSPGETSPPPSITTPPDSGGTPGPGTVTPSGTNAGSASPAVGTPLSSGNADDNDSGGWITAVMVLAVLGLALGGALALRRYIAR